MTTTPSIRVRNSQRAIRVSVRALQAFAEAALKIASTMKPHRGGVLQDLQQIDVIVVSDQRIATLHKRFMNIAGPTDVITFQHGELFISAETAKANARRYRTTTDAEIRLYITHGILHLIGFNDATAHAARTMAATQERVAAAAEAAM
ncbi:MAG TPA: rRNA maturation RNase YbeY [Chthoniobacterales bacterium]|nr:rRNA maturation RNase YbeY [Chthoniobacterales bacterium]